MDLKIKIGCDILKISRFEKFNEKNLQLKNLFTNYELINAKSTETLAGIFAAKEAIIKALEIKPGDWTKIEIIKLENGKPIAKLLEYDKTILSCDISISHDGEYVIATCGFLIKE